MIKSDKERGKYPPNYPPISEWIQSWNIEFIYWD